MKTAVMTRGELTHSAKRIRYFSAKGLQGALPLLVCLFFVGVMELQRILRGLPFQPISLSIGLLVSLAGHGISGYWTRYGVSAQHLLFFKGLKKRGIPLAAISHLQRSERGWIEVHYQQNGTPQCYRIRPAAPQDLLAELRKHNPEIGWR